MTTDKKQPPEGVLCLVRLAGDKGTDSYTARHNHGKWMLTGYGGVIAANVVDWRKMPSWDRLAILDRYDEERSEWEAKVTALTEENDRFREAVEFVDERIRSRVEGLNAGLQEALARAERAEKERDEWKVKYDDIRHACTVENDTLASLRCERDRAEKERDTLYKCNAANILEITRADRLVGELRAERDRAIAERDEARDTLSIVESGADTLRAAIDDAFGLTGREDTSDETRLEYLGVDRSTTLNKVIERSTKMIREIEAERDDLGCQLEALRAVQRDDVADLRTRMEAMEKWRAECELADAAVETCIANAREHERADGPEPLWPVVDWFAEQMKAKLSTPKNMAKGGWHANTVVSLAWRVVEETEELFDAVKLDPNLGRPMTEREMRAAQGEAVDVANMAMMVADNIERSLQAGRSLRPWLPGTADDEKGGA